MWTTAAYKGQWYVHPQMIDRGKRLFFSKSQYKNVKFFTTDFCELKDFETLMKKKIHMSYLSHAETLYFSSGSETFGPGSWSGAPDHDPVIFLSPGSTSAWIFPHDWGRMLQVFYVRKKFFFKVSKSFNSQKSAVKKWQFYPDFWKKDSYPEHNVPFNSLVTHPPFGQYWGHHLQNTAQQSGHH